MIKRIGRYEVQAELGRGGFGQVFRAYDPTVGRLVAIKTLTASGEPEMITRFRNEAAAAGKLRHHNIVIIYDFGEHEEVPFLVMELLDGEDIERIINTKRPLSLLKKLDIMQQSAAGLHHAHSKGVVHRDVKPANIMLLADGSVKIMDFGIALLTQATAARITPQGSLIGTLPFMAPEQFNGLPSDSLTDIFAYGITCYKLLTGVHPFHASEMGGLMYNIMNKAPTPARSLKPECPEALEQVISKLLAKDRDSRYQTLEDVQFDLEPIILDLRRENVSELLTEARDLVAADQLEAAQPVVRQAIELDPGNRTARELRELLQRQLKDRAVRPKVAALMSAGREQLGDRHFAEAIQQFESALRLDKSNPEIHALIEQARSAWEIAQRADRLTAEARKALQSDDLSAAYHNLNEALAADPQHAGAEELLAVVQKRKELRDREQRLRDNLSHVKRLILVQNFGQAIESAQAILEEHPNSFEAKQLLAAARHEQEDYQRRQKLQAATDEVKEMLRTQRFAEALERLPSLQTEFPEAVELRDLASYASDELLAQKQQETVARATSETQDLLSTGRFDTAINRLQQVLAEYPAVGALRDLLQGAASAKAEHQRKTALDEALRQGSALIGESRYAETIELIGAFVRGYGDSPALEPLRNQAEEGLARQRKLAAVRKLVLDAQNYLDNGQPGDATKLLHQGTLQYPDQSELAALLGVARESLRQQKTAEAISKIIAEAESAARGKRFDRALELIDEARKRYPTEERLVRSREAIQAGRAAYERELEVKETVGRVRLLQSEGKRSEALEAIAAALAKGLGDGALQELKQRIEIEVAEQKKSEVVRQAHDYLSQGQFDSATKILEETALMYPGEAQFTNLLKEVETRRRDKKRADALAKAVNEATAHIESGRFDDAVRLLDAAAKSHGADGTVTRTRESALKARTAAALAQAVKEATAHIKSGRFDDAIGVLDAATTRHGPDAAVARTREAALKAKTAAALAQAVKEATAHIDAGRFDDAVGLLDAATKLHGPDAAVARTRESALKAKVAAGLALAVGEATAHIEGGRFDQAVQVLDAAAKLHGPDASLARTRESALKAKTGAALAQAVKEATALIDAGNFDRAVQLLDAAAKRHGHDGEIARAREAALQGKAAHERETAILGAQSKAVESLKSGRPEEAIRAIDKVVKLHGEDARLTELRKAAEVSGVLQQAQDLLSRSLPSKACDLLRPALKLGASRRQVEEMLALAEERSWQQQREQALAGVVDEINRLGLANQYDEALGKLEVGLREFPGAPVLLQLREPLVRTKARIEYLALARKRYGERDHKAAAQALEEALQAAPGDRELLELQERVRSDWAVMQAQALIGEQRFGEAAEMLRRALDTYPQQAQLIELLRTVEEELRKQQRIQELNEARSQAEALLSQGHEDQAIAFIESRYATEPSLQDLLDRASREVSRRRDEQRQRELSQAQSQIETMLARGQEDQAIAFIESRYAQEPSLQGLLERARQETARKREEQRLRELTDTRAKAEALLSQGKEEQAIALIEGRYTSEVTLQDLLIRAHKEADRKRCEELIRRATGLGRNGQFAEGLRVLEQAVQQYGASPAATQLRDNLQRALDEQSRREARDRDLAELNSLDSQTAVKLRKSKLQKLAAEADAIAAKYPDDQEIRAVAGRIQGRVEASLPASQAAPSVNKVWVIGGLAAAVVVAAGVALLPHHSTTIEEKKKEPPVPLFSMEVRTDPAGAAVSVSGRSCVTPNCRFDLAAGDYSVQASLNGYVAQQQTVKLDAQHPGVVDLILQPEVKTGLGVTKTTGTLLVRTGVAGASVFVDNALQGSTDPRGDFRSEIAAAPHQVRVEKPGYQPPQPQRVNIAEGHPATATFAMTVESATLELRGAPAGISLRDNGTVLATNGRSQYTVPSGTQRIQISNGAQTFAVTHNFEPGKVVTLDWNNIAPKVDLEAQEWDRVQNSTDVAQIQSFVDKYGSGPHQAQAKALLDRVMWARLDKNDINALRAYVKSNPGGPHSDEVTSRIDALDREARRKSADVAWNSVDKNDEKALSGFIAQYPDASRKADAQNLIDQIRKRNQESEQAAAKLRAQQEQAQEVGRAQAQQAQAIQAALDSFNSAFMSHNPRLLKDVWPKASADYTENMYKDKNNFKVLSLTPTGKPTISGDTARVPCDLSLNAAINGRPSTAKRPHEVVLQKQNNRWIISDIL
jgi:predicted Zn-dependent protease